MLALCCQEKGRPMPKLAVDRAHARLTAEGGLPLFLLADDARAATTRAALSDWHDYLAIRAQQGFNAVLIDAMRTPEQMERVSELVREAEEAGMYLLAWREGSVAQAAPEAPRVLCGALPKDFVANEADMQLCEQDGCASVSGLPRVRLVQAHERTEARAALWRSILGGAFGGVVFSAFGLVSWDDPNAGLANASSEDFVFAKQAVDYFDLTWGEPWNEELADAPGAACARTSSTALVYVPSARPIALQGDLTESFVQAIDLTSGEGARLDFTFDGELSHVPAHPFVADALYVIRL